MTRRDGGRQGLPFGGRHVGGRLRRFGQRSEPVIRSEFGGAAQIEVSSLRESGHHIDALHRHGGQENEAAIHSIPQCDITGQQRVPERFEHDHFGRVTGGGDDVGDGATGEGEDR